MSDSGARAALPIPDFDHLPEATLTHRIRSLAEADLQLLLDYEREHGNRLSLTLLLERRLDELRRGAATPSSGDPAAYQPEHAPPPSTGSRGSPSAGPETSQPLR